MDLTTYPWFSLVSGGEIEQGDILEECPVFLPPTEIAGSTAIRAKFKWEKRNVIVLSQSCDMVRGRENIAEVLLCAVWLRSELTGKLAKVETQETARKGNLGGWQVIAPSPIKGFEREVRFIDLRRIYALPLDFVRKQAESSSPRLRLMPPYREHLSQSFARMFMRIGLPVDIPPFK